MKTTIDIPEALLAEAQEVARREGLTLKALIQEGLRRVIAERKRRKRPFRLRDASVGGRGLNSQLGGVSWERIRDTSYEGRGG